MANRHEFCFITVVERNSLRLFSTYNGMNSVPLSRIVRGGIDMKRREFLELAGGVCLAAVGGRFSARRKSIDPRPARAGADGPRTAPQPQPEPFSVICRHGIVCYQPAAGQHGGRRHPQGGRQCRRRGHRHQRHAQPDRADDCGPGGDLFAIVWSEKEQKLSALNASGRSPYDWTIEKAQALGLEGDSVVGPPVVERARLRQRLGLAAEETRQAEPGQDLGADDCRRPRRVSACRR